MTKINFQQQVADMTKDGKSLKEIAAELNISVPTVSRLRKQLQANVKEPELSKTKETKETLNPLNTIEPVPSSTNYKHPRQPEHNVDFSVDGNYVKIDDSNLKKSWLIRVYDNPEMIAQSVYIIQNKNRVFISYLEGKFLEVKEWKWM